MAPWGSIWNIDTWGVRDGPLSLEEGNNVKVLFLHGYLYWRLVEVVEQGGIGEAVNEVLDTAVGTLTAGKEEGSLTLWTWKYRYMLNTSSGNGRQRNTYVVRVVTHVCTHWQIYSCNTWRGEGGREREKEEGVEGKEERKEKQTHKPYYPEHP